jgi:ferric-dicitrate binding protein FerR (iron transport regulator)
MVLPRLPTLEEPTAEWIWRLNPNEFTAADLQAFNDWLRHNPHHRRTAQEFFGLWLALNSLESAGSRRARCAGESGRNVS